MNQPRNRSGGCRARAAILGVELRAAREDKHFGVRELARRIGVNPAQINSWESALRSPDKMDVAGILGALGVVGEQKQRILEIAKLSESDVIMIGQAGKPRHIAVADTCAGRALSIVEWHPFLMPGTRRTRSYVEVAAHPHKANNSALLNARSPAAVGRLHNIDPEIAVFISEQAIAGPVGDPALASQKIRFLLQLTDAEHAPNVTVNVVPSRNGEMKQAFTRYYTHAGPITYVSHGFCGSFALDRQELYGTAIDQLAATACNTRESAILIAEHAQRLDHGLAEQNREDP